MLKAITLKNFRKHRDLSCSFEQGLNVICGPNWNGKTTLLSAITYAFFGTKATPGNAADLTTWGEDKMAVALDFEVEKVVYRVVRGPKKASLSVGANKPIATGQTPVTEAVEKLIGSSAKDFLDFNVTRQEDAAALLTLGSAKLGEYVARVTGIDVIDRALEKLRDKASFAQGMLASKIDQEQGITELKKHLEMTTASRGRSESQLAMAKAYLVAMQGAYADADNDHEQLLQDYEAAREAKQKKTVAEGVVANLKEMLQEQLKLAIKEPDSDLASLRQQLTDVIGQVDFIKKHEASRIELEGAVKTAKETLKGYDDLELTQDKVDEASAAYNAATHALTRAEKKREDANTASESSMCPYCMRAFENQDPDALAKAAEQANQEYEEAYENVTVAGIELGEEQEKRRKNQKILTDRQAWEIYLEQHEELLKANLGSVIAVVDPERIPYLEQELEKAKKEWATYHSGREAVKRAEDALARAKAELKEAPAVTGPTKSAVNKADSIKKARKEDLDHALHCVHRAEENYAQIDRYCTEHRARLHVMQTEQDAYLKGKASQAAVKELQTFLRKNRERFTESFWEQLLGHASKFTSEATSGAVPELKIGDSGMLYVENGRERPINGNASGMQKAIFSTAIKLSLVAALGTKFSVLLFDEVTAAAGDDTSLLFTSLLARVGQQSLLVTHRQADAASADRVIEIPALS